VNWVLLLVLVAVVPVLFHFWRREYWGDRTITGEARRRRDTR
jgi:hypothetical protein